MIKKNECACEEKLINPLSGEIYDPITGDYVHNNSPYQVTNKIMMRTTDFCLDHSDEFECSDIQNMIKCIIDTFSNRVEYMLINILKEYESNLTIKPQKNIIPLVINEIHAEFDPIFNPGDYEIMSNDGCRISDILSEFIINNLVTFIMNLYLKYTETDQYQHTLFVNSNFTATSLIAIRLHSMFETIFTELTEYYRPSLAQLAVVLERKE